MPATASSRSSLRCDRTGAAAPGRSTLGDRALQRPAVDARSVRELYHLFSCSWASSGLGTRMSSSHREDRHRAWLNILLLMLVCLQPFVTTILGEYPENPRLRSSCLEFSLLRPAQSLDMSWYCHVRGLCSCRDRPGAPQAWSRFVSAIDVASLIPLTLAYGVHGLPCSAMSRS